MDFRNTDYSLEELRFLALYRSKIEGFMFCDGRQAAGEQALRYAELVAESDNLQRVELALKMNEIYEGDTPRWEVPLAISQKAFEAANSAFHSKELISKEVSARPRPATFH